jgi:hypothetical protein
MQQVLISSMPFVFPKKPHEQHDYRQQHAGTGESHCNP